MESGERDKLILRLEGKLRECEKRFDEQARLRGFDPAQAENMALPSALARLATEREELRARLEELIEHEGEISLSMPSEIERIQNQLQRAFEGDAWHGPSLHELLSGVDAATAAARPIPSAHSIWELVLHIAAWDKAVSDRLGGGRGAVAAEENFPAVNDSSDASWQRAIETMKQNHDELIEAVGRVEESRLDTPIVEGMSSVYVHLHGAVQHDLYHAGQIAILKKA